MATTLTAADITKKLQSFFDAWNSRDVDKILSFVTKDVIWVEPGLSKPAYGKDAAAEALRNTFAAFPDITWPKEDLRIYTSDDPTFAATGWTLVGTMTGRLDPGFAPTGKRVRVSGACLYEFREGLISRHTIVYDSVDAMQQIGLLPPQESLVFKAQMRIQSVGSRVIGMIRKP